MFNVMLPAVVHIVRVEYCNVYMTQQNKRMLEKTYYKKIDFFLVW